MIERRLTYAPPLAAGALFRFLGDRTIPGVESFDGTTFRRAVRTPDASAAVIELAAHPDREEVRLRVLGEEGTDPSVLAATARRLLDLDADPSIVDTALSSDPSLRPLVRATPGLRLPGTADGFELVVRAILGQQISVRAARTFAGRIAEACGTPLERPVGDVTRLFPTAERLADERAGWARPDDGPPGDPPERRGTRRVRRARPVGSRGSRGDARTAPGRAGHRAVDGRVRVDARSGGPGRVPRGGSRRATRLRVARAGVHARGDARPRRALASVARLRRHAPVEQPPRLA